MRPIGGLGCESHGTGLAVGGGLVLTAAHVLFDRADIVASCKLPQWARDRFATRAGDPFALRVAVRGRPAGPASLVASGRRDGSAKAMVFTGSGDFAILRVAAVSAGEDLVACDGIPAPEPGGDGAPVDGRGGDDDRRDPVGQEAARMPGISISPMSSRKATPAPG